MDTVATKSGTLARNSYPEVDLWTPSVGGVGGVGDAWIIPLKILTVRLCSKVCALDHFMTMVQKSERKKLKRCCFWCCSVEAVFMTHVARSFNV